MLDAEVLADVRNVIGESPVWLAATQTVYWVDAERGEVYWRADRDLHYWAMLAMVGLRERCSYDLNGPIRKAPAERSP